MIFDTNTIVLLPQKTRLENSIKFKIDYEFTYKNI